MPWGRVKVKWRLGVGSCGGGWLCGMMGSADEP